MHSQITVWKNCLLSGRRSEVIAGSALVGGSFWCKKLGSVYETPTYVAVGTAPNLLTAYRQAARGKRFRPDVAAFTFDLEANLCALARELAEGTYAPGAYRHFTLYDRGKPRLISAAPFRARVVHHALCNVLEPIFEPTFIHDSYACRKGKGLHGAVDRFCHFAAGHHYVLKADIRRYFPTPVVQVMQRDAIERLQLRQLLLEPEVLESIEPDLHLVTLLRALDLLLGRLPLRYKSRAVLQLLFLVFFGGRTGWRVSVTRASVMTGAQLAGKLLLRPEKKPEWPVDGVFAPYDDRHQRGEYENRNKRKIADEKQLRSSGSLLQTEGNVGNSCYSAISYDGKIIFLQPEP